MSANMSSSPPSNMSTTAAPETALAQIILITILAAAFGAFIISITWVVIKCFLYERQRQNNIRRRLEQHSVQRQEMNARSQNVGDDARRLFEAWENRQRLAAETGMPFTWTMSNQRRALQGREAGEGEGVPFEILQKFPVRKYEPPVGCKRGLAVLGRASATTGDATSSGSRMSAAALVNKDMAMDPMYPMVTMFVESACSAKHQSQEAGKRVINDIGNPQMVSSTNCGTESCADALEQRPGGNPQPASLVSQEDTLGHGAKPCNEERTLGGGPVCHHQVQEDSTSGTGRASEFANLKTVEMMPAAKTSILEPDVRSAAVLAEQEAEGSCGEKDIGGKDDFDNRHRCAICLGAFEAGELVRTLPCSHDFHQDCIDSWMIYHVTCPMCRHMLC
ncbi:hypothetical protein CEUSTIGMA_g6182.t1 [Chlamydomonas eustigma]|uniref:RING-type domain-containing protein n=1 Tax=Chlamydomonas eustigma TaxID=1157962 RepID=A0A250X6Q6_9CHLO|nr:hypothetical protein CEUSTIGMA_g6182.t1 [Chlamydomonas eustigma]|eukprot:GAX78745.1 hypothetical protein CEUSTIGMA_g6182.t1 [Chlamydomonas eustigma]